MIAPNASKITPEKTRVKSTGTKQKQNTTKHEYFVLFLERTEYLRLDWALDKLKPHKSEAIRSCFTQAYPWTPKAIELIFPTTTTDYTQLLRLDKYVIDMVYIGSANGLAANRQSQASTNLTGQLRFCI